MSYEVLVTCALLLPDVAALLGEFTSGGDRRNSEPATREPA